MRKTKNHKYCVVVEHEIEDTVHVKIEPYTDSLEEMHRLTHSDIVECIQPEIYFYNFPFMRQVDCFIDEEGKLNGKYPTMPVWNDRGILYDVMCGTLLFIDGSDETGETFGMTEEEAHKVADWAVSYLLDHTHFDVIFGFDKL